MLRPRRGRELPLHQLAVQLGQVPGTQATDDYVPEHLLRVPDRRTVGVDGRLLPLERFEPLVAPGLEADVFLQRTSAHLGRPERTDE
jgi:hypothetical protein